jgi:hypothetical protein
MKRTRQSEPKRHAAELLDAVPVQNEAVRTEPQAGGGLVLRVPIKRRWYARPPISWILPFSRDRAVGLDRLGREVWEACDGDRTVEEIVETFSAAHELRFHEARISVMQFLRGLTRRGLVVLVGPSSGEAET